jgi:hypothetical protein
MEKGRGSGGECDQDEVDAKSTWWAGERASHHRSLCSQLGIGTIPTPIIIVCAACLLSFEPVNTRESEFAAKFRED